MTRNTASDAESTAGRTPAPRGEFSHGWVIVAAGVVILTTTFGIYYSFGVFFRSLQEEFSWNRATTSSIFSFYLLFGGAVSIVAGRVLDRYGPRIVVATMGAVSGLSLVLTSMVQTPWQLFLTYSVLLSIGTGAMYLIVMSTGSRWFHRRRAAALGVIGAGGNLGAVLVAPLGAWLISTWHWRTAYLILGVIAWVVLMPAALLLKKEPSAQRGRGDGGCGGRGDSGAPARPPETRADAFSLRRVITTRNFQLFFVVWFCYSFCLHMVFSHLVPRVQDLGVGPVKAAAVLSFMTFTAIPCRLFGGFVSDRVDKKWTAAFFALLYSAAMLQLAWADRMWMIYLFAVLHGMAYGGIDPPLAALVGDAFGLARVGAVMGVLMIAWGMGSASGPYLCGLVFDYTGGYGWAFFSGGAAMALAVMCLSRVRTEGARFPGD